jgi:hypothetical protein
MVQPYVGDVSPLDSAAPAPAPDGVKPFTGEVQSFNPPGFLDKIGSVIGDHIGSELTLLNKERKALLPITPTELRESNQTKAEILDATNPIPFMMSTYDYLSQRVGHYLGEYDPAEIPDEQKAAMKADPKYRKEVDAKLATEASDKAQERAAAISGGYTGLVKALGIGQDKPTAVGAKIDSTFGAIKDYTDTFGETASDMTGGAITPEDGSNLLNLFLMHGGEPLGASIKGMGGEAVAKFKENMGDFGDAVRWKKASGSETPISDAAKDMKWTVAPDEATHTKMHEGVVAAAQHMDAGTKPEAAVAERTPVAGGVPDPEGVGLGEIAAIKNKPGFAQTPEDRLKLRQWDELQKSDPGYAKAEEAMAKPAFLRTAEDRTWVQKYGRVAGAAGLGLAAWQMLSPNDRDDSHVMTASAFGLPAMLMAGISRDAPLGSILEKMDGTTKVMERLDPKKFTFSSQDLEKEFNRDDVPGPEKAMWKEIHEGMKASGAKTITAKDLVSEMGRKLDSLALTEKVTDEFASYGLEAIGRATAELRDDDAFNEASPEEQQHAQSQEVAAKTSIWQVKEGMDLGDNNHFGDPRYFGHTRSFVEDGVKHVVEIQSDAVQRAGKKLTAEEKEGLQKDLAGMRDREKKLLRKVEEGDFSPSEWAELRSLSTAVPELVSKLRDKGDLEAISPIAKNWERRLIREEIGEAARKGEEKVRFATADTVAKVEGWPMKAAADYAQRELSRQRRAALESQRDREYAEAQVKTFKDEPAKLENAKARVEYYKNEEAEYAQLIAENERDLAARPPEDFIPKLSPEHQGIYDRYRRDVAKFLKSLGAADVTDAQGHTWHEVPTRMKNAGPSTRVQQMGMIDSDMLRTIALGSVGVAAGYALYNGEPGAGTAIAALGMLGYGAAKVAPHVLERLREGPLATEAMKELVKKLEVLEGTVSERGLSMVKFLKDNLPEDYGKHAKEIALHLDDPTKPISPRGKEMIDKIIKPIQDGNRVTLRVLKSLGHDVGPELEDYGFHRMNVKRKNFFEQMADGGRTTSGARGFNTSAPSMQERKVFQFKTADGDSLVGIKEKGGVVGFYKDGKVQFKGKIDKDGKVTAKGKEWTQSRATISDIEQHTKIEYHKEALLAELDANLRLNKALANAIFLRDLKQLPLLDGFMKKVEKGDTVPEGWIQVHGAPQLMQYHFDPRVGEALQDFVGSPVMGAEQVLAQMNRVVVGSMFWTPVVHVLNVLNHAIVEKGVIGSIAHPAIQLKSAFTAYKEVNNLGPQYRAYLKEGAALMYADRVLGDFHHNFIGKVLEGQEGGAIAKAFGYADPREMISRLYKVAGDQLWKWNDIFMMQAYLEKEARGVERDKALGQAETHIPSYRMPTRILGSRRLKQILSSPALTAFSRYDYNRLASYGSMVKDVVGRTSSISERLHATDQLAMLGLVMYGYYKVGDAIAKMITGNENATMQKAGAATIPAAMIDAWNEVPEDFSIGDKVVHVSAAAAKTLYHLSPMTQLVSELANNRDGFTGKPVADNPKQLVLKLASQANPLGSMNRVEQGKATWQQVGWAALGVKDPSDAQVEGKEKANNRRIAEERRAKKKAEEAGQ